MLTIDHLFDSTLIRSDLRRDPGAGFGIGFRRTVHWYQQSPQAA
jgi:hypothetical protein